MDQAYSVEEAARRLSIGRTELFRLMKVGEIARVKIGRRTVVPAGAISDFLTARTTSGLRARETARDRPSDHSSDDQ